MLLIEPVRPVMRPDSGCIRSTGEIQADFRDSFGNFCETSLSLTECPISMWPLSELSGSRASSSSTASRPSSRRPGWPSVAARANGSRNIKVPVTCAVAAVKQHELVTPPGSLWLFRGRVRDLFLKRLPGGFVPDKTLLVGFLLTGCHETRFAFGNFRPAFRWSTHTI